jgi:acetate kinase
MDTRLNDEAIGDAVISQPDSGVAVLVIRAREELVAARAARAVLAAPQDP